MKYEKEVEVSVLIFTEMPKKPAYAARYPSALDPAAAPLPIQARDLLLEARSLNSREEPDFENTPIRRKTKVELRSCYFAFLCSIIDTFHQL